VEELAERRSAHSADHAGLEVEERRAGHVLAVRGLVVKGVDLAELRVVVAAIISKLSAYLVTALGCLNAQNLAQRSSLEAGSTQEKKGGGDM
jgi:hypothetical protein